MASIRDLKKDINFVLGDLIEHVYLWEATANNGKPTKESEAIVDDAIKVFDDLMARVNQSKIENKKAHFNSVRSDLETEAKKLVDRINSLSK